MNKAEVRDTVRKFLPTLMFKSDDDAFEKTNKKLNPLIEDNSIDGFDTSYDDTDGSFSVDIYYVDGLCDTFTVSATKTGEILEELS